MGTEIGLTANRYRVSFWGDGNVLELAVVIVHTANIVKTNALHSPVVKYYVNSIFLWVLEKWSVPLQSERAR